MYVRVSAPIVVLLLATAKLTSAQSLALPNSDAPGRRDAAVAPSSLAGAAASADQGIGLPKNPVPVPTGVAFTPRPSRNPFAAIGQDLKTFFTSRETAVVMGVFAPAAGVAYTWDNAGIRESQEHLSKPAFQPGNIGGSFLVQTGAAVGTWAFGSMTGNRKTAEVGGDLIRAQLTSQVLVQGLKLVTRRPRPDGSDNYAFPSGHTASAFATATVLERHFGWKAGIPAFGFATYVGLARMSANKHNMSDVIMGAAMGIASARAVTVGAGDVRFSVGVAPTQGGAAVTFTKQ
jgi:putative Ca2+/H+ antiporter (TMEM165/GDT1 family)